MTTSGFLKTWRGTMLENRIGRVVILVLAVAVLILAIMIGKVERTIVLVPPGLEKEVTIARESADQDAKEAWALYVTTLIGNVTADTVDVLTRTLEPMLSPNLSRTILEAMRAQVEEIKREHISMRFLPREVTFDPATQTIFVTGRHRTEGPGAPPVNSERTYEMRIDFRNYRPLISYLDAYAGDPKKAKAKPAGADNNE